jgi:uncharacterized membrane protein YfcA
MLLLNYSEMTPSQVVGTDLLFGLVLAVIGSIFHGSLGSVSSSVLFPLLLGGLPGVLLGCVLSRHIPAHRLRAVIAVLAICAGLQLVVSGVKARGQKAGSSNYKGVAVSSERYRISSPVR